MISSVTFASLGVRKGKEGRQIYQVCITTCEWVAAQMSQRIDTTDRLITGLLSMDSKMLQDNLHLAVVKEKSPNRMSVEAARLVSLLLFFSQSKISSVPELKTGKQIYTSIKGDQESTLSAYLGTRTPASLKNKQTRKSW